MHVTKGAKLPLESGYVQTSRNPNINHYTPTVYALDCEMVSVYFGVVYVVYPMTVTCHGTMSQHVTYHDMSYRIVQNGNGGKLW